MLSPAHAPVCVMPVIPSLQVTGRGSCRGQGVGAFLQQSQQREQTADPFDHLPVDVLDFVLPPRIGVIPLLGIPVTPFAQLRKQVVDDVWQTPQVVRIVRPVRHTTMRQTTGRQTTGRQTPAG